MTAAVAIDRTHVFSFKNKPSVTMIAYFWILLYPIDEIAPRYPLVSLAVPY